MHVLSAKYAGRHEEGKGCCFPPVVPNMFNNNYYLSIREPSVTNTQVVYQNRMRNE